MSDFNFLNAFTTVRKTDKFSEFKLKSNGLHVVLIPYASSTNTLSCTMNYHVGSYDERVGYTGSAHLLEHLLFKDPLNGSDKNIFQLLDKHGATINATTAEDRTNFYAVIPKKIFDVWVGAEAARVKYIPFDVSNRDKKEKLVVVDELRMGNDNPFKKLTESVMGVAFDRSGYNHMTSGFIEDVKQTTQEKLQSFWQSFYGPNNASMVIVGPMNANKILKSVYRHFNSIEPRKVERFDREEVVQNGPRQTFVYNNKPYTMVQCAFRAMEGMHPDSLVLDLIAEIMQYPKIGILNVLKEANVTPMYAVRNNRNLHRHMFQITAAVGNPQIVKVLQVALWKWFAGVGQQSIDENVINLSKSKLKNKWNKMYEGGVESIGAAATEAVSLGNIADMFERHKHLDNITMKDINRVASYIFQDARCTVGVLCPEPPNQVLRPQTNSEDYAKQLFQVNRVSENVSLGVENITNMNITNEVDSMQRYKCNFGILQHVTVPHCTRDIYMISTKAINDNSSLGEIACKVITDGIEKSNVEKAHSYIFESNTNATKTFNEFMIEKNLNFKIFSNKGNLNIMISMDKNDDNTTSLSEVAKAIKNIPKLTNDDILLKIRHVTGEWSGQEHDIHAQSMQKLTSEMFEKDDINYVIDMKQKLQLINAIKKDDLEFFINNLFDSNRPFMTTVISNNSAKHVCEAINTFHEHFSTVKNKLLPFEEQVSVPKAVKSTTHKIVNKGLEDGLITMGLRVNISRVNPEFTALRLAMDVLGDGIYSRLNKPLRVEKGLSYGVYSRLRGGHHGSDSFVHLFGSFKVDKLVEAKQLMQNIFEEFVHEGITKQEFEDKKSHLKNSLSVRMDNINNCFMLHHQTLLNGNQMTYNEILNRVKNLTLKEVNDAIEKHLVNKPIITIIAGLDK